VLPVEIFAMSLGAFAGAGKAGIGDPVRNWQWVKESESSKVDSPRQHSKRRLRAAGL
jgi:hypothetical protein